MGDFYRDEMTRALSEQSYGISAYSISTSSRMDADAEVTILEGSKCTIHLNCNGYKLVAAAPAIPNTTTGVIYENMEELLQAVSPLFLKKRGELLVAKLNSRQRR
ncbi:hypothetical protein SISNIDRAFT_549931 [Sistotremastrum niveocremeum HHB9708]|uniref:GSKIP domain-containing protein n=2 Tax=Sistotremastraceae TaxID=3402574 RepID=A0A164U3V3_9AGAM|nr:hypothetical protein SISNIDRAFT_549931 [Sistotremastrum niveocremeum HHB9708]KZT44437.1 hypothetical protein SISSUDRAFT_1123963 [Sistotremastrum suecicum HHB10207 ss-3]